MTGPEGNSEFYFPRISMFPRSNKVETSVDGLIVGLQFGLRHVVVPLSFLQYVVISIMPGWFFQWSDHVVFVDIY